MKWVGTFCFKDQKNTIVHDIENLYFTKDKDSYILSDQYVLLGGKGYLISLLHLVTILRKERTDLRIITNDVFKSSAEEISILYHSRWQIVLFFKPIKQHMTIHLGLFV